MPRPRLRRRFALLATIGLVWALVASACPTCDVLVHAESFADLRAAAGLQVDPWPSDDAACACCETSRCSGREEAPEGWFQRAPSGAPLPAGLPVETLALPRQTWVLAKHRPSGAPPGRAKLHILHASFLC